MAGPLQELYARYRRRGSPAELDEIKRRYEAGLELPYQPLMPAETLGYGRPEATISSREPTLMEKFGRAAAGSSGPGTFRRGVADAIFGTGEGFLNTGLGIAEATPLGTASQMGELASSGRGPSATEAMMFIPGMGSAARKVTQAVEPVARVVKPQRVREKAAAESAPASDLDFLHGRYEGAKFPQFADQYPPLVPGGEQKIGERGNPYIGKAVPKVTDQFMAERLRIQKEIDQGNIRPYFDVSKRYDVDPADYPRTLDTADAVAAKQATRDDWMKKLDIVPGTQGREDALQRLMAAYERGQTIPNTDRWYLMGQWRDKFRDVLGPEEGHKQFDLRFATPMAEMTAGLSPKDNLMAASYINYMRQHGLPISPNLYETPSPVGGDKLRSSLKMAGEAKHEPAVAGQPYEAFSLEHPKRTGFRYNFLGHPDLATMDKVMSGTAIPGFDSPPRGTYGMVEGLVRENAARLGVDPRAFQDVGWGGAKAMLNERKTGSKLATNAAGRPMIQEINEAIERTHRLTGRPREEIVEGMIRGTIPVYGLGGVAAGGAALGAAQGGAPGDDRGL